MPVLDEILATLPEGTVKEVRVGAFWTAVVVDRQGQRRCGLAATLLGENDHHHTGADDVADAGHLARYTGRQLAALVHSSSSLEVSLGMAAINALLPAQTEHYVEMNAEEVILAQGAGRRVAVVGHFPFLPRCRAVASKLWVLEKRPHGDDLPAEAAPDVLPQADVVAMSGTTIMNRTFDGLMALCQPGALVLVLGPSTPLSPVLFDYGVNIISGSIVEDVDAVLRAVSEGANFRQVRRHGVRLVTMHKP